MQRWSLLSEELTSLYRPAYTLAFRLARPRGMLASICSSKGGRRTADPSGGFTEIAS
jgi:hypothetical protein